MSDTENQFGKRLGALVDAKFGPRQHVHAAKILGVTQAQLSRFVNGKTMPEVPTIQRLAAALGVPFAELVADPEPPDAPIIKPLVGTVSAGKGIDRAADRGETMEVPYRMRHADSLYRVQGASMVAAGIDDGDIIGVRDAPNAEHGEIVVAWLADPAVCVVKMLEMRLEGFSQLRGVNGELQKPIRLKGDDRILGVYIGKIAPPEKPAKKAKGKR
jgi:SOS-response transcriptional repressor LexA